LLVILPGEKKIQLGKKNNVLLEYDFKTSDSRCEFVPQAFLYNIMVHLFLEKGELFAISMLS
jgi:hypothetical protein